MALKSRQSNHTFVYIHSRC